MHFIPIKTRPFLPPKDNLFKLFRQHLPPLKEKDILVITSKIVSIHQSRCIKITKNTTLKTKIKLIKQEADAYFKNNPHSITLKDQTLTPYAGIDRSNANNHYILWPNKPHLQAKKIWHHLREKHHLKKLGIIITDSFCLPLRWGHLGISIGFYGFYPNKSYLGQKDIFGYKIIQANSNIVDALAALSTVIIGEGNEQTPLLIIRDFNKIKFTSKPTQQHLRIPKNQSDLYQSLINQIK